MAHPTEAIPLALAAAALLGLALPSAAAPVIDVPQPIDEGTKAPDGMNPGDTQVVGLALGSRTSPAGLPDQSIPEGSACGALPAARGNPETWMVRGCFLGTGGRARPFVDASFQFPSIGRRLDVALLVDTGADRTIIGPADAAKLGVDIAKLPRGQPLGGIGGQIETRSVDARLIIDSFSGPLAVSILEPGPRAVSVPSVLGRDLLSQFALFLEERTGRVLLLGPRGSEALPLP